MGGPRVFSGIASLSTPEGVLGLLPLCIRVHCPHIPSLGGHEAQDISPEVRCPPALCLALPLEEAGASGF